MPVRYAVPFLRLCLLVTFACIRIGAVFAAFGIADLTINRGKILEKKKQRMEELELEEQSARAIQDALKNDDGKAESSR